MKAFLCPLYGHCSSGRLTDSRSIVYVLVPSTPPQTPVVDTCMSLRVLPLPVSAAAAAQGPPAVPPGAACQPQLGTQQQQGPPLSGVSFGECLRVAPGAEAPGAAHLPVRVKASLSAPAGHSSSRVASQH
jgi:hypothetical protein